MDFVTDNLIYVVLAVVSGGMLLWQTFSNVGVRPLSPQEATLLMNREDALVIDVRDIIEWSGGHVSSARHLMLAQLEAKLSELDKFKTRPLIICCQSGARSALACRTLKKHGFEQVYNLSGGIAAWREAGLPLTTK